MSKPKPLDLDVKPTGSAPLQPDLVRNARPRKRSVRIKGHPTSVTLEDAFWNALADIAAARNLTAAGLIEVIDQDRGNASLSSSLRVFVLEYYRNASPTPSSRT